MKKAEYAKPKGGVMVMEGGLSQKTERSQQQEELYIMRFFDVEDFWRLGDTPATSYTTENQSRDGSESFTQTASWEEALDLGINGWPAGVDAMQEILEGVQTEAKLIMGKRKASVYNVHGSQVDVARALSGEPYCMRRRKPVRTADGNHIRIAVNISTSCMTSTKAIMNRGAAVCALVSRLENDGYAVELTSYEGCCRAGRLITEVPIKRPEDFLNKERVAMMIAHPSSLRRGMFAVQERLPKGVFDRALQTGYGRPMELSLAEREIMGYSIVIEKSEGSDNENEFNSWAEATPAELAVWVSRQWNEATEGVSDENE